MADKWINFCLISNTEAPEHIYLHVIWLAHHCHSTNALYSRHSTTTHITLFATKSIMK